MNELPKRFDFKSIDQKWSTYWEDQEVFHARQQTGKEPYTIVIPPPNVTGILHMGHALNNTLQDIIIRYKRMNGFETLWMAGTDHAGIATQNVVEKALAKEGKTRDELGREEFLNRLWQWKQEYGDTIIHQLKKLGASCDWQRARFTMDDEYSQAVNLTFVKLYDKGLIYRGQYIINWCPRCHTALSDEEAEHEETQGALYHFRYPFKDHPDQYVIVATTRPETMIGDTAVAVNPNDDRYQKFIGKKLVLPLMHREIPIIADEFVDPAFGTGAVKVTPAHDPNDFEMGQRHNLESINIMHPDARLNEKAGEYQNLDRFQARKKIVEALRNLGLLEKIDDHTHAVGHCYRCHTVVEPYLSRQWFVKMKPLAEPAANAVRDGEITFYPNRWEKVYLNWMDNIRDWCISRQIWWGHRIPVWYDDEENIYVALTEAEAKQKAQEKRGKEVSLRQDPDVLDTWFSSWLWPFATLYWPKDNAELKYFYPTASLFTASEIIFFWVARMIMAGLEFMGEIPFKDVYIHGTVRDDKGRKMSKSLGNALDPLEIIEEYGADALRFSLIMNSGQDLFISKDKFEIGRNFANKMWNAARLILLNVKSHDHSYDLAKICEQENLDLTCRWIISRFYSTLEKVSLAIEKYRYSEAENEIYDFFWGNFCDWYLEM
ncbi:MAG: valine--tRNA ligase, partial [Candidatus Omnitrophica bacterium]|nr:valine--tRNA ligase [Candidatus Omnitrophota bacterium]